jgi:hypothetical protein
MGNRATVVFTDGKERFSPAVYLHWNGGAESVYGFLEELNRRKVGADQEYECARFIQLVGEFFDQDYQDGNSLGVVNAPASDRLRDLYAIHTDKGDNGIYLVNRTTSPMTVRRFNERYKEETMVEMAPEQVEHERKEAYAHKYGLFREDFKKIAGKRGIGYESKTKQGGH